MPLFKKTPVEKAAIAAMKAADKALNDNSDREHAAGIRDETPEYLRLNGLANDAASKVPFRYGGTKRN